MSSVYIIYKMHAMCVYFTLYVNNCYNYTKKIYFVFLAKFNINKFSSKKYF